MINIAIEWEKFEGEGEVVVTYGKLSSMTVSKGKGDIRSNSFKSSKAPFRLKITIADANTDIGPFAARVTVNTENPFTFFLRDVNSDFPIYIPSYGVVVTPGDDTRSYKRIRRAIEKRGLVSGLKQIELEPEETYDTASKSTYPLHCKTWLGISRDERIFELDFHRSQNRDNGFWGYIIPRFHSESVGETPYIFALGRGMSCTGDITRRNEDGVFPILHSTQKDGSIMYDITTFVTLEKNPLKEENVRGTHFLVADGHSAGHMFTDAQKRQHDAIVQRGKGEKEETVLFFKAVAANESRAPRYAHFKTATPSKLSNYSFNKRNGFVTLESGKVFCISKIDKKPMPDEETAILLQPGQNVVFEFYLPHSPISKIRAKALAASDFSQRHKECRSFWQKKLKSSQICLPEKRIEEMVKAGIIHLDLAAYGKEPNGALAATPGVYSPIGTESAPIIQFFDCMGWHDTARRALMYFLEKQHDDGFMQNFGGYMVETGAVLWCMGEHYRYTKDNSWIRKIKPKLLKSCECLIRWRRKNQKEELRGRGYGMLDGKVGDPEDPYHYFMNSGYAYLGLKRASEMLHDISPENAKLFAEEAKALKHDIRESFFNAMKNSPAIPLDDGTWCPTAPPWTEYCGPVSLLAEGGKCFTHNTFTARDSLVGPLYLIFQEIIEPDEPSAGFMVNSHHKLFCERNVGFSQPYYCRHPFVHLQRGEVKAFLKTYYNGFAGLADRETYTFWEHYHGVSPHKTHEEAWFLMQTRWMLYLEKGRTLRVFPGIPRSWLADGKQIRIKNMVSYFGPISVLAQSKIGQGVITAEIECRGKNRPEHIEFRLPHPYGKKAKRVSTGQYDPERESICISKFSGKESLTLHF